MEITAKFWSAETDGTQLGQTFDFASVNLNQGVFALNFALVPAQVESIFGAGNDPVFIEISSGGKTYPRQRFSFIPLALRVPVDNKTVAFDSSGALSLAVTGTPAANQFLTKDGTGKLVWQTPTVSSGASNEPPISAGSTSQYWRGDKSWQTLSTASVPESGTAQYYSDARARSSLSGASPVAYSVMTGVISMAPASANNSGYLSSSDWGIFSSKQNALGFVPLNKAGDTMTGELAMGGAKITALGLPASAGDAASKGYADANLGGVAFDQTSKINDYVVKWSSTGNKYILAADQTGSAGGGITTFNGLNAANQTLAVDSTGTTPAFSSSTSTHTLHIPMAATSGATAGLISNTDYANFNGKQSAGNYLTTLTGDVTTSGFSAGSAAASLASVSLGGTSTKVTYDVKGRVTAGTTLSAEDIPPLSAALITSGTLAVSNGGTGVTTAPLQGQLLIGNGTGYSLATITAGTGINVTTSAGGITVNATADASTKVAKAGDTMTGSLTLPTNGLVVGSNQLVLAGGNVGIGTTSPAGKLDVAGSICLSGANCISSWPAGSVTSVSAGTGLTGGPITTSGSLSLANTAVTPGTYTRASITVDAQGRLTAAANGSNVALATEVTGTLPIANGGTGATTAANAFNALSPLTTLGDLLYGGTSGAGTRLAGNTTSTKHFLTSTGSSGAATAPSWSAIAASDLPAHSASLITSGVLGVANGGTGATTASANTVFAGPTSGTGAPTFRALVVGDYPTMVGANGSTAGTTGAVPGPAAADNVKFLRGDGTWAIPTASAGGANNQIQYNNSGALGGNAGFVYSGGNVGIGTTAPTQALDVNGAIHQANNVSLSYRNAAGTADIRAIMVDSGNTIRIGSGGNAAISDITIDTPALGQTVTVKGNSGNVGIGSTSPTAALDTAGSIRTSVGVIYPDGSAQTTAVPDPSIAGGRLTTISGTPATTSDVTAVTTLYYTPYISNRIAVYTGSTWQLYSFNELSLSLGSLSASTNYDIFINNNSGTLTLSATAWTNNTTRQTNIVQQDGVWVKSGATSFRYLGTLRTTAVAGQTEDSVTNRLVWNVSNRLPRKLKYTVNVVNWGYSTNVWRPANNNTNYRVNIVVGIAYSTLRLKVQSSLAPASSAYTLYNGIAEDATNTSNADEKNAMVAALGGTGYAVSTATMNRQPTAGFHYYQWTEYGWSGTGSSGGWNADDAGMLGEIDS